jgi:hypothetical protein
MQISYSKKQLDALISQIYSWNKILHVSGSTSVYHQEFFTVKTAMLYVTKFADILRVGSGWNAYTLTYTIAVCTVKTS